MMNDLNISIVVPTFNEAENIPVLIDKLKSSLDGFKWELIVVDDNSPDGTANIVREIGEKSNSIRCLQRLDRKGLSSACIDGMHLAKAPLVAVIDADLQHDETLLPKMIQELMDPNLDIVVGSRYTQGAGTGDWSLFRLVLSRLATLVGYMFIPKNLTDPMSGFFMIRRNVFLRIVPFLYGKGFKILLDLFASSEAELSFKELPYTFRNRIAGESKLSSNVIFDYIEFLIAKAFGRLIPSGFFQFSLVGMFGVGVHFLVLSLLHKHLMYSFTLAQVSAIGVAMTSNFFMNNAFTYRHTALKNRGLFYGLLTFYTACAIGAVVNLAVAVAIKDYGGHWAFAGISGGIAGAVWNFVTTRTYTWKSRGT